MERLNSRPSSRTANERGGIDDDDDDDDARREGGGRDMTKVGRMVDCEVRRINHELALIATGEGCDRNVGRMNESEGRWYTYALCRLGESDPSL